MVRDAPDELPSSRSLDTSSRPRVTLANLTGNFTFK
jgi:hypothetical protein